ncbi:uncharacterized protein [Lepeophtheirus salmonis]|uniref:uncharacterized protein n=1 Tax=Lepeophtheirus salmonis TaxID=72036 RepID=UPI001AE9C1C7|nr:uncharacterized protein LOC121129238 [Lepeophtheirus salmonis]
MSSKTSTILCSSGIFIILLLLAGAFYYTAILSSPFPENAVYYAKDISLGIAFSDEEDTQAAISSIQRIKRGLKDFSWSFTPNIKPINVSVDSLSQDYNKASDEVKFFFGYQDEELSTLERVASKYSVFISPFAHFPHHPLHLIRNNLDAGLLAKVYRAYFEAYRRGTKTVIVCVLSPEDQLAIEFYGHLKALKTHNLEISLPVAFTQNSSFPSSDAWQIISDIGSKLAWAKRPYIFFLSDPSNVIPYLSEIVETHPEIAEHPWVLRTSLTPWPGLENLAEKVGLHTISYFALGDDEQNLERRAQCLDDGIEADKCHVYESLMRFHRSASIAIQDKTNLESAYSRDGFESPDSLSLQSGILAVKSGDDRIRDIIKMQDGVVTKVIVVRESYLHRNEVSRWARNVSKIDIYLEPGILLPYSHLMWENFENFPDYLTIPQTREETEFGLHLKLKIDSKTVCICVPSKLDHGKYICDLAENYPDSLYVIPKTTAYS